MATKTVENKPAEQPIDNSDVMVRINLPLLESGDGSGNIDQTVVVQCDGKNHNRPLIIQRGVNVEIPVWAFEILIHSGRFPNL